jgi:hypothetical protein
VDAIGCVEARGCADARRGRLKRSKMASIGTILLIDSLFTHLILKI